MLDGYSDNNSLECVNKRQLFVGTVGASGPSSYVISSVLEYFIRITLSDTDYSLLVLDLNSGYLSGVSQVHHPCCSTFTIISSVLEYFIRITSSETDYSMSYSLNLTPSRRTAAVAMTKNKEIMLPI